MRRRHFLRGAGALLVSPVALANEVVSPDLLNQRFQRPDLASEEGGLWATMDREESKLKRSPFVLKDEEFRRYVQEIACRLAGNHCPDIRVYLVKNHYFNASMAPNGMLEVWSGLMLRVENEAQLAAVIGHEIGHYLERHSLAMMRDAKARTGAASFLQVFGLIGGLVGLLTLTGGLAYSRDNERRADEIGMSLMSKAGYDTAEAAKVWQNLLEEAKANPETDPAKESILFATHPPIAERAESLTQASTRYPKGDSNTERWQERCAPFRRQWLNDEIKRGQAGQSLTLLTRLIKNHPQQADYLFARAEVYRNRNKEGDLDAAIKDYLAAKTVGKEPPETHRGLAMIYRERKQIELARSSFHQYLELAPAATDAMIIRNYIEEMKA